ncbi:MAG: ATP-binding protein, partial [Pedobacter sp.]
DEPTPSSQVYFTKDIYDDDGNVAGETEMDLARDESEGTRKFYTFIGKLYRKFQDGGLYICDEIDSNFHPSLLQKIIELFQNPNINKANAQLLFTSHDTNLMNPQIMRRDQFYFAEKLIYGSTKMYSLADLKGIRNNADFARQYLAGIYGALPVLGDYLEEAEEDENPQNQNN